MLCCDVQALSIVRAGRTIIQNFSFGLAAGEMVAFMGASGSGKTSLVHTLLDPPTSTLTPIEWRSGAGRLERPARVGLVQQGGAGMPEWMTAGRYVSMCAAPRHQSWRKIEPEAANLFEEYGLSWRFDRLKLRSELSGGMMARVCLIGALVTGAHLLILDEPFAGIDTFLRYRVLDSLKRQIATSGQSGLLITHAPLEAFFLADRVVFLVEPTKGEFREAPGNRGDARDALTFDSDQGGECTKISASTLLGDRI